NDTTTTNEDTPVTIPVLANDSDPDNPLGIPIVGTPPSNGTVIVNADSTITYIPDPNFNGTDSFTYSICDGGTPNLCDTATVFITIDPVNDPPVAVDDTATTSEDTPVNIPVVKNDGDPDNPLGIPTVGTPPANGTVVVNADSTITYIPDPNFNGTDSFTYSICDGGTPNLCDTATVYITIDPVNDPPVAVDDSATTNEDTDVTIPVLANDSDPDSPLGIPSINTPPANGSVVVNADSSITYTPDPNFNGTDSFTYAICDGGTPNLCDTATVYITIDPVNDPPVAVDDTATTNEDTPVNIPVVKNDSDPDSPLGIPTVGTPPVNGSVVVNADSTITYIPDPNFNGTDSFTYSICDGGTPNLCDTATVYITIDPVNDPPVAVDDTATTSEDTPVNIPVVKNDSDPDNPLGIPTVGTPPVNGSVVVNADSTITYIPDPNFNGTDSFTYSICDGGTPNLCDTATVFITIDPVNDPPVAVNDTTTTNEDTPVTIPVLANDSDPDSPLGIPTVGTPPVNGSVVVNADSTITYIPDPNFNGTDSFTYAICDGGTPILCDTAIVYITIDP
ncbi:cadherin-like domain-containing protein, partial [Polluticoccus soli]|uniref:cadherin-like domain-containing protein n=1 Tax=Polluticoccus soli TaxID=3034150 RepID=UPI0023E14912